MKSTFTLWSLLISFCFLSSTLDAQYYDFSISTGEYNDLENSISLNNGEIWDDPEFELPIGFNFQYFEKEFNTLFIHPSGSGAWLTTGLGYYNTLSFLIPYGADIIDRGYETEVSESNISYLLVGEDGGRIYKLEWNNIGFYSELMDDGISEDFTNIQMWLYEEDGRIEIRIGPNSITQPEISFDEESGSFVWLIDEATEGYDTTTFVEYLSLAGTSISPVLKNNESFETEDFLDGSIPEGIIYTFTPKTVSVSELSFSNAGYSIEPNPVFESFRIVSSENAEIIESVSIYNVEGKTIRTFPYSQGAISVSDMEAGSYIVKVHSNTGEYSSQIIKQ